ncbi:MAG TPA: hemolysin family protein [Dehalococcoidia bacterium]|nr:hemolysin family protein [Dehalococcoidia bacterium]
MNFVGLAAVLATILGAAIVNGVEIAVISANRISVHHLAEGGSRTALSLQRLQRDHERFFAAVVFLQTSLVVFAGAIGSEVAPAEWGLWGRIGAAIVTAAITAEFGDLIPKVLGAKASVGFALFVALPAEAMTRVLAPIIAVLSWLPRLVSRLIFGVTLDLVPSVSEAELRTLIESSAESGSVAEAEAELLDRVFHFGDRHVHEVMVPRTEVVWIEKGSPLRDFYAIYAAAPHSRFPIFDETPDRVVGILGIKDLLRELTAGRVDADTPVETLARPAHFVPETKLIGELFREMQASGTQMAIAVDEFGGTAGIVTLEQLLEEMVGPVRDELRPSEEEIMTIDERTIQVDGSLSVEEARDELGIDIPEGPYDTIAGFVLSELGHVPKEGEVLAVNDQRLTVALMKGPKIERLLLTKA